MSEEKLLTIEIDGRKISAPVGARLIDVADAAGIPIPRFCYHEKLSVAANCRMCLVDIEKMPKPSPACATTIAEGMIVRTRSDKARDAQKAIMEFLLINHPLDCPICDQGGECELQDFSIEHGAQDSLYIEEKRSVPRKDIGPLVETYMNRCIQCTRCVRYGEEIAGLRELGGLHRGDRLEITTFIEHALVSEVSANIIDICPVGALTAKPSKFQGRPWEYVAHDSVSIHDGLGTNTAIHTLRGKITRVVSRRNDAINSMWIADRDRFSYEANFSDERIQTPMIRNGSKALERCDWVKALAATRMVLEGVVDKYGADNVGVFVSPSATVEEMYLAQKLMRSLGVNNIDSRFNQLDFSDDAHEPSFRSLGLGVGEVSALDSMFLVGADPRMEVPVLAINMREAVSNGAQVSMLSSYDADQLHKMAAVSIESPANWVAVLAGVLQQLLKGRKTQVPEDLAAIVASAQVDETVIKIASQLKKGQQQWIVLGQEALSHPEFAIVRALALTIAEHAKAAFGYFTEGANTSGAYLTQCIPSQADKGALNTAQMIAKPLKAYVLVGAIDPEQDFLARKQVMAVLKKAEAVIHMSPFTSPFMNSVATIVLPTAAWGETEGSLINFEGKCQTVAAAAQPSFEAKPLWKILRVLGNEFDLAGFDYITSEDVLRAWLESVRDRAATDNFNGYGVTQQSWQHDHVIMTVPVRSLYSVDAYVRRAKALQQTPLAKKARVSAHPEVKANLNSDKVKINLELLTLRETEKMAKNCIRIPREYSGSIEYYNGLVDEGV